MLCLTFGTVDNYHVKLNYRLCRSKTWDDFESYHNDILEILTAYQSIDDPRFKQSLPFPKPMIISDCNHIYHIDSPEELLREGRAMHHCVAGFVEDIYSGTTAIYHYSHDKTEATIEVSQFGGDPKLGQVKGPCNKQIPLLHAKFINAWFKRNVSILSNPMSN